MKQNKITKTVLCFLDELELSMRIDREWLKRTSKAVGFLEPIINWNLF